MTTKPTVGDEYSALADLLANLIAKYADELVFEDDPADKPNTDSPVSEASQGSLSQASLLFLLQKEYLHDILYSEMLSKLFVDRRIQKWPENKLPLQKNQPSEYTHIPGFQRQCK